jgi:hypothetical protein
VVAAVGTTGSSGSPGSIPATPGVPAGVVAGSKVLLVVVTYDSVSGTQHPSDVTVPSGFVNDGWAYSSGLGIGVWWKDATGSDTGTYSVTAATAGALDAQAFLLSFPVATPSGSPFGPHGALATAQISTSSISTGSLTPTANDALLLAFGWSTGGGSTLDVSGGSLTWSVLNNAFNSSSRQHKTFGTALATPAAVAATLTSTGSTDWLGLVYGQIVNAAASNPATLSGKVPVLNGTVVPVFHWDADQSGQPNGTVITQANSVGGTNSVLIASQIQGSPTFANDNPFKDTLSAKAPATTGTKATIGTTWSGSPIAAVRFYVCFPAYVLPTTATQLMQWISNGANFVGLTATGKMYLVAASVTLKTSAASIVADTWYWVSVYSINGTNGTLQWEWHLASDDSLIESYSSSSVNTGTTLSTSFAVGKVSAAGNLSSILIDHVEARIGGNATGLIGPYVQPVNVATLNGKVPVLTGSLPDSSVSVWSGGTPPTGLTAYNDAHPTRIGSTFYLYGGVTGWSTIGMRFYITNELIAGNQIGSDIPVYLYTVPSDGSNPYNGSPLSTATIPFASITVQGWYTAIWPTPVALTNVIPVVVAYQIGSQAYLAATMTGAAITNAPVALSGSTDTNGSYSWVRSYYEYMDILSAGNGTYWTGVDLIVAPVVAGSGGSNNATLNGSVPVLTGSDTGAATNPATLSGKVPVLTGTDTGTATNAATLNGQVPTLTGSATGTAVNAATLNGAVPVLTGSFTAGNISGGTVTGSVPVLTGSIAGTQTNVASLSGSVVALSGSVVGSAVNTGTVGASTPLLTGVTVGAFVVPATLSGAVPVLTGSATGTLTDPASLSGTTPVLTGSASGTVTNPGTLSGKLPSLTGLMLDQTVNVGILNGSTPPLVGGFVGTLSNPVVLNGAVPLLVGSIIDANIVAVNITIDIGPTRSRTQADIALTRGADSAVGATRLGWTADPTRSRAQASVGNTRGGESSVGGTRSRVQADVANTRSSTDIGPTRG